MVDVKNARYTGLLAQSTEQSPGSAAEAMLFDCYNPWAALIQLNSTHPLTGRRILRLGEIAKAQGRSFTSYDIEAAATRVHLSRGKLRGQFLFELLLLLAPLILGIMVAMAGAWQLFPAAIAAGVLLTLPVRYPFGAPSGATVMALMSDPAASPVRGRPVSLEGKAIGRVAAGFIAGEDVVFQDKTGLMAVDFRSMLGAIGDLFAGWKRVPQHLDKPGTVTGWFKRSMGSYLVLREPKTTAGALCARPLFWQVFLSLIVIVGNILFLVAG